MVRDLAILDCSGMSMEVLRAGWSGDVSEAINEAGLFYLVTIYRNPSCVFSSLNLSTVIMLTSLKTDADAGKTSDPVTIVNVSQHLKTGSGGFSWELKCGCMRGQF